MKSRILVILFAIVLVSCKTTQNAENDLNYIQNIEKVAIETSERNSVSTIQTGDQLIILITAKDMDVVRPFNQNYSSSELIQTNALAGGNTPAQGITNLTGPTYIVDTEGYVDFPIIGKIETKNKTLVEFKNELREKMLKYVINPTVNVRLANFKVSVLGEVNKQGDYTIVNGQGTIFNALALAGDLTMFGKRNDVVIIRNEDGKITHGKIDLQDANLINSPYYNLKQGDVIIISANKSKNIASRQNPNTPLYLTAASIFVTAIAVVVGLFKK